MRKCLVLLFMLLTQLSFAQNTKRVALIIGAQNYTVLPPLRNSLQDAQSVKKVLQQKGFTINMLLDPKTKKELKDAINWYFQQMQGEAGATGLIYYAGHGMQYQGDNYIIPTSASLNNPGDLEDNCLKMNTLMAILNSTSKSLNILLLDACRSLPSFTRDVEQGLTKMHAPEGTIVVFAAQAGKVASDGTGTNGLFTSKLLTALQEPGLNITDVFQKVKREVYLESKQTQLPSVEDNTIGGHFYFTPGAANNNTAANTTLTTPAKEVVQNTQPTNKPVVKPQPTEIAAPKANLYGLWQNSQFGFQMTMMLNEDGTGEFDAEMISFKTQGNKLIVNQAGETTYYTYTLQPNALTLTGGDLPEPLTFTRLDYSQDNANSHLSQEQYNQPTYAQPNAYIDQRLVGTWMGNGETIEFRANGQCIYLGYVYQYQASQGYVVLQTVQGNLMFGYAVAGKQLSLTANGIVATYFKQ
jgi:hypothetical protein